MRVFETSVPSSSLGGESMSYCKHCGKSTKKGSRCNTCISRIRRIETKKKAVEYLGGKCQRCGYNEHLAPMEFHHTDPSEKDFNFGDVKNKKWDTIKGELDKCILLCSNCHRIEHSKYDETAGWMSG